MVGVTFHKNYISPSAEHQESPNFICDLRASMCTCRTGPRAGVRKDWGKPLALRERGHSSFFDLQFPLFLFFHLFCPPIFIHLFFPFSFPLSLFFPSPVWVFFFPCVIPSSFPCPPLFRDGEIEGKLCGTVLLSSLLAAGGKAALSAARTQPLWWPGRKALQRLKGSLKLVDKW